MANAWFRMYAEFAGDPKVQALSEPLQRRYVMLLCMKCNGDLRYVTESNGNVALRVIATALRITEKEAEETKNEFILFGLIDQKWEIVNWDKRQYISDLKDPTNSERQKRYRETHSNGNSNGGVTEKKRPDTDTDTETERTKEKEKEKSTASSLALPVWLDPIDWQFWCEHRKGKTWTKNARKFSLQKLEKLYGQGHDPGEVIRHSIASGYQGLFPEKNNNANRSERPAKYNAANEAIDSLKRAGILGEITNGPIYEPVRGEVYEHDSKTRTVG